ncbi:MAG: ABC transporter permease [Candidatus Nitronauta litoralis]|uniref:Heme exporter protein B n=1 Tax=Candidatus Nitronauta litoralis TaxID=2705533 RepID=A0A7T0BTJ8_9BACT|nr:MAG: ABC transporter permease [Candidatus Nitronauta litoralis]
MNSYFGQIKAIVWKDFLTEFKTRELFSSMFVFAVLVILIFIFSVDLSLVNSNEVGPGVLWVAVIFAGTLGLNRSFTLEKEHSGLQGLLLAPIDRSAIYFGKMLSNLIFFLVMEAFILPVFMVFFNIDLLANLGPLLFVLFIGTLGFSVLGTLLSSLSSNLKTREIMLPLLLYPLMVPIAIGSVRLTAQVLRGGELGDMMNWVGMILCFDVIFLAVSIMTIDHILEE